MILLSVEHEIQSIAEQFLERITRSGPSNIMAICPFHRKADGSEERTPSFAMNISNGLYFCHACQSKGNLYTFLRDLGISRSDITLRYGVVVEAAANNIPPKFDPLKSNILENHPLPESFLGNFDVCPTSLLSAGFTQDTLRKFDVGFDTTHNRITFPLRDYAGQLAGISGRDVTGESARYKVYTKEYPTWGLPERHEPDKRKFLWNVHTIYPDLYMSSGPHDIVVVEGFKACMWVWQAGIKNVVAILGTYLSEEQAQLLERLGATIHLFLDFNRAGLKGLLWAGDRLARSQRVKIMEYPSRLTEVEYAEAQPDSLSDLEIHEAFARNIDYLTWRYDLPTLSTN